ncbi:hypothetical protein QUB59_29030 [Microcoleus sp. A2-D5]
MVAKPRIDRDFTRVAGDILRPPPRFLHKCHHRYRNFPPEATEYEFFDTTIALLLWQLYK